MLRWVALAACLVPLACGGSAGGSGGSATGSKDEAGEATEDVIAVRVAPVRREPVSAIYATSTTLRPDRQATVIARTKGVVRRLAVEEGDRVGAGQSLAVLEDDEQKIEAERTRTAYDIERGEFERASRLFQEQLISQDDYEAARRGLEEAKHAFARAELELERTIIRAPFAGKIVRRHLDVGATVADGTAVYDLADLDPLYADVSVPERHVGRLAVGQSVRLTADASGDEAQARIERIAPAVDAATGTVKVTLAVEGAARLRPGAFVRADIVTETRADALVVRRSALVAEGRRWHLFRLQPGDEAVEQIVVATGFEEGDRVEVAVDAGASAPLAPGDRVVVAGAPALSDGARVRVLEGSAEQEPERAPDESADEPA